MELFSDFYKTREGQEGDLLRKVEALIFAAQEPLSPPAIVEIIGQEDIQLKQVSLALAELMSMYQNKGGGFVLESNGGKGYHFRTNPELSDLVEHMFSKRPRPLSRAAQETLAIIAYRQPVTRVDIEFIRGVDAGSIIKNLLERDMIACVGRKEIAGRPMLFATTPNFLQVYNLKSLEDLPPLDSFQPTRTLINEALETLKEQEAPLESSSSEEEAEQAPFDI